MSETVEVDWYFDLVSPFAYLQLEQFGRLPVHVDVTPKPVVLGALWTHWNASGPAEIPRSVASPTATLTSGPKAWASRSACRRPPVHPIRLLWLAIVLGSDLHAVRKIFRFVWRDGRAVKREQDWRDFCKQLGVSAPDNCE